MEDDFHSAAIGCEHRPSEMPPQRGRHGRIGGADEGIDLQEPKPEVEKDSMDG